MRNSYWVIGSGALGSYVGMCLHQTNAAVVFHCRSNYEAIQKNGLTISNDQLTWTSLNLSLSNGFATAFPCSVGLLCTKSSDNDRVLSDLAKTAYPKIIVCMQNGIGLEEKILQYLPDVTVISTVCFIKVTPKSSNHFHHDFGKMMALAQYDPSTRSYLSNTPVLSKIKEDLTLARMTFHPGKFEDVLWTKLAFNASLCLLSILHNESTTQLAKSSEYRHQFYQLLHEVEKVAESVGAKIDLPFIMTDLSRFAVASKPVFHSMKLDYDQGKSLELESMFFNLQKIARKNGVKTSLLDSTIAKVVRMTQLELSDKKSIAAMIERRAERSAKKPIQCDNRPQLKSSL